jgi:hypothetical protein
VTSHSDDGLAAQLLAAVGRVAAVDPGPSADAAGAPDAGFEAPRDDVHELFGVIELVIVLVGLAVALPILGLAVWLLLRVRRRRAEEQQALADDRGTANERLIAVGDDIRALDLDVSMPGADPAGVRAYEQALAAYERAEEHLAQATTRLRLERANADLDEARRLMDEAKLRLERTGAGEAGMGREQA